MSYVVLAAGGHAKVVIEALRTAGLAIAGATDADAARKGTRFCGVPILGDDESLRRIGPAETMLANGLGNRASASGPGLERRRSVFEAFSGLGFAFPAIRHASAVVASDAELEPGAQVLAGVVIQPAARVGRNTIVNTRAVVEHDCVVGAHCHIAPGALLCGGVSIADGTHVGAGAVLLQNVRIGVGVVIAAGVVVDRDVADGAVVRRSARP